MREEAGRDPQGDWEGAAGRRGTATAIVSFLSPKCPSRSSPVLSTSPGSLGGCPRCRRVGGSLQQKGALQFQTMEAQALSRANITPAGAVSPKS